MEAFSGGNSLNPLDDGTYRLHLDIQGDESTNQVNPDGSLKPFFGIQKMSADITDSQNNHWNGQIEWGTIRARLNPTNGATDHGDYFNGKKRPRDYTHGCICDRSETILSYLWNLVSPPSAINVVVTGGLDFNLEQLVRANVSPKIGSAPRMETAEFAGRVRGLDGTDSPDRTGCQAFLEGEDGAEIELHAGSPSIQSLVEAAFITQSPVTVVHESTGKHRRIVRVRFNKAP